MSLHPAIAAVRRAVRRSLADLEPGATVIVACSGGADSMALLSAIMMALYRRERTGKGGKVSSSLMANGVWSNSCLIQGELCGSVPFPPMRREESPNALVNLYRTKDGRYLFLLLLQDERDWPRLATTIWPATFSSSRVSPSTSISKDCREVVPASMSSKRSCTTAAAPASPSDPGVRSSPSARISRWLSWARDPSNDAGAICGSGTDGTPAWENIITTNATTAGMRATL